MKALRIHAGPAARRHIEQHGLRPQDVGVVPGAAGGPKGLVLGPLDRFIFGEWLAQSSQPVHLVGASIGAWRMATACLGDAVAAFERLERDYIAQDYDLPPGRKTPTPEHVSERFGQNLQSFYGGRIHEVVGHSRYRLHIVTSRGMHVLGREHRFGTPLGYLGAFLSNTVHRKAMGAWLERVVFSSGQGDLPFATGDFRTRQVPLDERNFQAALQASCSIPFVLRAIHDIPGAPPGAYWDGGITDYHLHLDYHRPAQGGLVLYPHFQKAVVPGWLDKGFKWRHRATPFLDNMVVLAPDPAWVATLPNGKLPDRTDFPRYGTDLKARMLAWNAAVGESRRLADEFAEWVERPDSTRVEPL
jgi:hypothetical protein